MVEEGPAHNEAEVGGMAEHDVNLDQMLDLATPWCLHAAATLRLPGHIAAGHHDVAELAAVTGCDRDALHALLGYLVSKGVFRRESPGRFACNQAADQLAEVRFLDLDGIGGRLAHAWGTVLDYVRTGQPAYQKVFGRPFWEDLAAHPAIAADFDALMGPPARDGGPLLWLHVADLGETLHRVTALGGAILEPPSADGPTRVLATIADPEGNPIGLASHAVPD
jgi:2,7-dihydroxy-5-methyl-1-naphthoate 7-O-methyltransferase